MSRKAIRKANRSGTMICAVCCSVVRLTEHHIHGREVHDWDGAWNRVWLCPTCHDGVHTGDIIIEGWYGSTSGRILIWRNRGDTKIAGEGANPPQYHPS